MFQFHISLQVYVLQSTSFLGINFLWTSCSWCMVLISIWHLFRLLQFPSSPLFPLCCIFCLSTTCWRYSSFIGYVDLERAYGLPSITSKIPVTLVRLFTSLFSYLFVSQCIFHIPCFLVEIVQAPSLVDYPLVSNNFILQSCL